MADTTNLKGIQEASGNKTSPRGTTEERLAAMKAEREKKLAEQKAARPTAKEAYEKKQADAEATKNKAYIEQILKDNPDTGAGGLIGSSVMKWSIDPKTGKKRTPKEIIAAVTEAVLADKTSPTGTSLDPLTGKPQSWTPAEKVRAALGQLAANAQRESKDLGIADQVFKELKGSGRGGASSALANKPETWMIGKDKIGTVVNRKIFDEPNARPFFILDPTKNQLTPEQIKAYKESGAMPIDPVNGFQVLIDDQGRYTLGEQPVPNGDTRTMDYSKYIPGVNEKDYGMVENPNFVDRPVDEDNMEDFPTLNLPDKNNPNKIVIDPVTGKPVLGKPLDANAGNNVPESTTLEERQRKENALASLTARFAQYGLESLIPKIKELVINGSTESTIALELAETNEYKQRFKANTERLKKGLSALDPGTYIGMEDSYRQALRAYGLKQFDTDDYVSQFIANDISANELSNRIVTAVQRVQNADPAITSQLREFYNIGQNDLVAYVLDPNQGFQRIERQVQAAEIGVAAARQGLKTGVQVAEQLAAQGVSQAEAQKGYATIADILPDAKRLSDIYGTTLDGYDQAQAEQEVFNQLASAQRRRQNLTKREVGTFSGSSGTNKTSLTESSTGKF